jgi:NADP-reducing hydrogenase subunit HndB
MTKIGSLEELAQMREKLSSELKIRELSNDPEIMVQVKVAMSTCGIAAGAKEIMTRMITLLDDRKIDSIVTQCGCMGYCYAEPTIEVQLPGKDPVVFGRVSAERAEQIVDRYIVNGESCEDLVLINKN